MPVLTYAKHDRYSHGYDPGRDPATCVELVQPSHVHDTHGHHGAGGHEKGEECCAYDHPAPAPVRRVLDAVPLTTRHCLRR